MRAAFLRTELAQLEVGPDRAEHADRHVDPEHGAPVDVGEQAADDEADERAGDARDHAHADREAALVRRGTRR